MCINVKVFLKCGLYLLLLRFKNRDIRLMQLDHAKKVTKTNCFPMFCRSNLFKKNWQSYNEGFEFWTKVSLKLFLTLKSIPLKSMNFHKYFRMTLKFIFFVTQKWERHGWFKKRSNNWRCSIFICHRMRFSRSGLQVFQILYLSAESLSNTSRTTRTTGTTRAKAR